MAELVDATDLKSVGDFLRAGSIPAFRTNNKSLHKFCVDSFLLFWGGLKRFLILNFERKKTLWEPFLYQSVMQKDLFYTKKIEFSYLFRFIENI